jgi:hypothetical protein
VPSQWQQQLLNGRRISLDGFCTRLLDPDSSFWQRHGFATLTRRWAEVVGPDNLTVVVVDEDDPRWLLHVFERMLSLRDGTLPLPPGRPNRSLSLAEAETLRKVNIAIAKAGWSDRVIHHYVREGVSAGFKRIPSDAGAGRPRLSRDLHERLAAATSRDVDELLALGVHVVGDVSRLTIPPWQDDDGQGSNGVTLAPASVASAVLGVVRMAEDPVPLSGTPGAGTAAAATPAAAVTSEGVRARLLPRRSVTMLAPEGAAGDFARADGADGPAARRGRAGRVLLTVVPPWQVLAGRWQARLLDGEVTEYAAWLDGHPEAWELPDLLARARGLATPRRITVVVGDARFPSSWTETTAGLRRGGLSEVRRSLLTWPEAEWLRELNVRAREDGLPDERRRQALAGALRWTLGHQPGTDPGAHPLEGDQLARAQALGRELRSALEQARVDVLGDLDELTGLRSATAPPRLAPRPASWPILGAIASADVRRA